jgi:hypothetical protein
MLKTFGSYQLAGTELNVTSFINSYEKAYNVLSCNIPFDSILELLDMEDVLSQSGKEFNISITNIKDKPCSSTSYYKQNLVENQKQSV